MARAVSQDVPWYLNPLTAVNPGLGVLTSGGNPISSVTGAVEGTASAVKTTGDVLGWLSNPHNWVRISEGVVGILLIGIGINAMLKSSNSGVSVPGAGVAKSVVGSQLRFAGTSNIRAAENRRYASIAQSRESARSAGYATREGVRTRGAAQRELFRTGQLQQRKVNRSS